MFILLIVAAHTGNLDIYEYLYIRNIIENYYYTRTQNFIIFFIELDMNVDIRKQIASSTASLTHAAHIVRHLGYAILDSSYFFKTK